MLVLDHDFIAKNWRQKPRVWRNAFDPSAAEMSAQRMELLIASARAARSDALHSSADTDFLEHAELHDGLNWDGLSHALESCTSRRLRIDVTITRNAGGGIGAHFDDSDNFVFQVEGRKIWRLHSPDILEATTVAARLSKQRHVGRCNIPEDTCEEFLLAPGDVLYLPFLWPHWGLSDGASTSVSAVIDVLTPLGALAKLYDQTRSEPGMFAPLREEDQLAKDLMKRMRQTLCAIQSSQSFLASSTVGASVVQGTASFEQSVPAPTLITNASLPLDMARVRELAQLWIRPVPFGRLVLADNEATAELQSSFSAYMLKRTCQVLVRASQRLLDRECQSYLESFARIISTQPAQVLAKLFVAPLYTAIIFKLKYLLDLDDTQGLILAISALGTCFLDVLIASDSAGEFVLPIVVNVEGMLNLPITGCRFLLPRDAVVSRYKGGIAVDFINGQGHCILSAAAPLSASNIHAEALHRLGKSAPFILSGDPVLAAYYPRDRASRATVLETLHAEAFARYAQVLTDAWKLLQTVDSVGAQEAARLITVITPVKNNQGLHPNNQSMHAFRGLVAMSARPTYMSAQVFMHESGHNKFSTILDLCQLYDSEQTPLALYSPFTRCERPVIGVLHGLFAFSRDLAITRKLMGHVPEIAGYPMERYCENNLARWKTALDTVRSQVVFNDSGQRLIEEMERVATVLESS